MKWLATIFSLLLLPASGLAQTKPPSTDVSQEVEARTGHQLNPAAKGSTLPEGVSLDDGMTEDEAVAIALRGSQESLVVPWSAALHDVNGGEWVYENTGPQTFVRRRLAVRYVTGSLAALARGPAVGAKVVSAGAAELFGTEFGTGK